MQVVEMAPHKRIVRIVLGALSTTFVAASLASISVADETRTVAHEWGWIGGGASGDEAPIAVARDADSRRLALADGSGVSLFGDRGRERVSLEGVRDLAFDREGLLWVATDQGLYRWADGERPVRRPLRGGEMANRIRRLVASPAGLLVATEADAYWSVSGASFQALSVGGTSLPVDLVAVQPLGGSDDGVSVARLRLWVVSGDQMHAVTGFATGSGLRVVGTERVLLPRPMTERRPVDMASVPGGETLVLVFEDALAWRSTPAASQSEAALAWRIERPVLPPGAKVRRLAFADGRIWLATDHGLLVGDRLEGSFVRAAHPVGTSACSDVERGKASIDSRGLAVLCRRGIFEWRAVEDFEQGTQGVANAGRPRPQLELPPLADLRERALDLAGLSTNRSRALRKGLSRRAYWPDLSLRLAADVDRDKAWKADQSFSSGDTRQLYDRSRERYFGYGAVLIFDWDLGGIAYPEDSVDLSRELRQVVSLRDDISDEINQLYFARLAIDDRLAHGPSAGSEESRGLQLRAGELDAGLDAWTGGWLTRWRLDRAGRANSLGQSSEGSR